MLKALLAACVALALPLSPAFAQDRATLGIGRIFNNDALGDGHDRWRTGSYTLSVMRGQNWQGQLPASFGEILEYRLRGEIVAPRSRAAPSPRDRLYAGIATFGVHSHFAFAGADARLGADLNFTGKQTGLGAFQRDLHKLAGIAPPKGLSQQIPNHVYPSISGELARSFAVGPGRVRPFIEAQAGFESLVRMGGDITIGRYGEGDLMLRDATTGQLYPGIVGAGLHGFSFTLGADMARVFDSELLPKGGAAVLSDNRSRLRAGMHWRGERAEVFYGVTRLGKEFDGQSGSQTVGSLRINFQF